jgi:serine/threonine protein kinase
MPLPTHREYQDAIQNPRSCFSHPELQQSKPETDNLGLPRPRSGNFAVVFSLILGSNKWAVRCFTTYHPDQEMRYQKISQYLNQQALPYTVDFEFMKQGIKVKGSWYPILRMEWVEGESLLKYIERNLNKPAEIQNLAEQFYRLVSDLKKHGIAHGDLQHGNIIVVNRGCRLVDYDGMFVPGLEGFPSNEIGHPNYQHPLRSRNDFGPYLDNFSAWCIYISLLALAVDPGLWHRISAGDEHICFRRKDIENPDSSPAMQALEKIKNDRVQGLFALFKTIIYCPDVCQIPSLDSAAIPKEGTAKPIDEAVTIGPDWLKDYIKKPPVKIPLPSLFERAFAKVLFLLVCFALSFLVLSNFSNTTVAVPAMFIVVGLPSLFIAMSVRFRKLPENAKKARLSSELRALQSDFRKAEGLLAGLEEDRRSLDQEKGKKICDITLKQRDSAQMESNEIAKIDKDLRDAVDSITSKKNSLVHEEATELAAAQRSIQTQYLLSKLSLHSLESSSVMGIGPEMTRRLHANGIRTAADVADVQIVQRGYGSHTSEIAYIEVPGKGNVHVEGIGPKKAQALLAWKQQAEKKIRPYMPKSLAPSQENAIRSKYFSKRQSLDAQEADAKKRAINSKDGCKARFRKEQEDFERQLSEARKTFANKIEGLDKQISERRKYLSDKRWKTGMVELELKSYAPITFGSYFRRAFFG